MNLKSQKVEEIELDFRDSFDSDTEGKVILRLQYVHNPVGMINDILKSLQRSEDLILDLLSKIPSLPSKRDLRISTFQKTSTVRKDTFYNGGRFYSNTVTVEENKTSTTTTIDNLNDSFSDSKGMF